MAPATRSSSLAASQVGIDARFFVTAWNEVFVNPTISRYLGSAKLIREGCLSLPGQIGVCCRYPCVWLSDGREYKGEQAIIIQHEIDHLNGVLITGHPQRIP